MEATLSGLKRGGEGVVLTWSDGLEAELQPRLLRIHCPCATCVSEVTGERILDPATVPEDLALGDMKPVGNYAYRCLFSDGHDTGIFTLEALRALCLEAAAGKA